MEEEEDNKGEDMIEIKEPRIEAEPEKEKIKESLEIIEFCIEIWKIVVT